MIPRERLIPAVNGAHQASCSNTVLFSSVEKPSMRSPFPFPKPIMQYTVFSGIF